MTIWGAVRLLRVHEPVRRWRACLLDHSDHHRTLGVGRFRAVHPRYKMEPNRPE